MVVHRFGDQYGNVEQSLRCFDVRAGREIAWTRAGQARRAPLPG